MTHTHRLALSIAALALFVATPAEATPPTVEVIVEGQQQPTPEPEREPEPFFPEDDGRAVGSELAWGTGFRLGELSFGFDDDDEIEGLNGTRLAVPGRVNVGGIALGLGYRPLPWLRLPEIRIRLGGGDAQMPWSPVAGSPGLEARADRVLVGAVDLVVGVQAPFEKVSPFLRGYVTAGFASVRAEVRHPELGALGAERSARGWVGAGLEAGFTVHFNEALGLTFAYRHGLYGPETSGAFVGLAILGDD
jgi:hypothetical protein